MCTLYPLSYEFHFWGLVSTVLNCNAIHYKDTLIILRHLLPTGIPIQDEKRLRSFPHQLRYYRE